MWYDQVGAALSPGVKAAEMGFEISAQSTRPRFAVRQNNLQKFEGSRAVFFARMASPIAAGDRLVQKDLANTYQPHC